MGVKSGNTPVTLPQIPPSSAREQNGNRTSITLEYIDLWKIKTIALFFRKLWFVTNFVPK